MIDLNNKNTNTLSPIYRRITVLKKYIIDKIDADQEIKRMMRYNSKTPTAKTGEGYDGVIKKQPDLVASLLKAVTENGVTYEEVLYNGRFNVNIETISKNQMFVYSPGSVINDEKDTQAIYFYVDILISEKYEYLKNYGEERTCEIADRIAQLFNGVYITNEDIVDIVGNVKTVITGRSDSERLSKNNDIILFRIPIVVNCLSMRVRDDG